MTYASVTDYNLTSGFQVLFVYANDVTSGLFINMLLFSIWILIVVGSYYLQKTSTATGDISQSLAIGCFVTSVITILLSLITGLVPTLTISVVIAITILVILFFLFSKTGQE